MTTPRMGRTGLVVVTLAVVGGLVALANEIVAYRDTGTVDGGNVALAFGIPLAIFAIFRRAFAQTRGTEGHLPDDRAPRQATATFQNYEYDTYPQTRDHTAKKCKVAAVRIDFIPRLPPGKEAHISLEMSGGAKAELGQTEEDLQSIDQRAFEDGSLGFGFHFTDAGRSGSAVIVIKVPGRPTQRITVLAIP